MISNLKINLNKRKLIPIREVSNFEDFTRVVGYKVGTVPSSYLGLFLGASFKSLRTWKIMEERFQKWFKMWKRQYLSKGMRLTLVKSTLSSLPIYYMSLFIIHCKVSLRLEKIQRDFIWGRRAPKWVSLSELINSLHE